MTFSAWAWAIGAGAALIGSVFALGRPRALQHARFQPLARVTPMGLTVALLAAATGVGWRAWDVLAWPGTSPADALAMLAGGGLVVAAWWTADNHSKERDTSRRAVLGLTLIGAAALLGVAAALAGAWPATQPVPPARTWLLGLRNILASIGLGAWLPSLAASVRWYAPALMGSARSRSAESPGDGASPRAVPSARLEAIKPAEDLGRASALFGFPWLTAACLASGAWNMIAHAAIGRAVASDLWLLAAWLFGGAYLTLTSSWQPLRLPGWLSPSIAAAALATGVLAASTAASLR